MSHPRIPIRLVRISALICGVFLLSHIIAASFISLPVLRTMQNTKTPNETTTDNAPSPRATTETSATSSSSEEIFSTTQVLTDTSTSTYIEVTDSCGPHFGGTCVRVRSGAGTEYPVISQLRNGVVLKTDGTHTAHDGTTWYKIVFDEWLRYPERIIEDWYVSADYVTPHSDVKDVQLDIGSTTLGEYITATAASSTKKILIARGAQTLHAYEGDTLFMESAISTGKELTPTPRGTFTIFRKTPSRYMQGPLPYLNEQQYYDLPGVPWNLYFTEQGAVIHGAYWHNSFGSTYSHGCVNLKPNDAEQLFRWADVGTIVVVRD